MFCAISGEVPEEPVVSRKSGLVFEKRLIEKALTATGGKCPETGDDLTSEDLISVKTSGKHARPIASAALSFPGLMQHLQSEWDALMLESHNLKKSLSKTKQELAHALYQCDAATRVISRLMAEKEELKNALANPVDANAERSAVSSAKRKSSQLDQANGNGNDATSTTTHVNDELMVDANAADADSGKDTTVVSQAKRRKEGYSKADTPGDEVKESTIPKTLPDSVMEKIEKQSLGLRTRRKARTVSQSLTKVSDLKLFVDAAQSAAPESSSPATCILLVDDKRVIAGYGDGKVSILNPDTLDLLENRDLGHGAARGGVTCLARPQSSDQDILISGGGDGCIRLWDYAKSEKARYVVDDGAGIVDIDLHPCNTMMFSCSENGSWAWRDMETNRTLSTKIGGRGGAGDMLYRSGAIHPDGLLFVTGCANGVLEMWDLRTMKSLVNFEADWSAGNVGVSGLSMSENGYYLASAINGTVAIWDLRKHKVAKEFKVEEAGGAMSVRIDYSGMYGCAVSEKQHVVFSTKKKGGVVKEVPYSASAGEREAMLWRRPGVAWGEDAKALFTGHATGEIHRYSIDGGVQ